MRISKMPPWLALKAGLVQSHLDAARSQAIRRDTGKSTWRETSEHSEVTLKNISEMIEPERARSPGRRADSARLPGLVRSPFSQCSGPTAEAGSRLLAGTRLKDLAAADPRLPCVATPRNGIFLSIGRVDRGPPTTSLCTQLAMLHATQLSPSHRGMVSATCR